MRYVLLVISLYASGCFAQDFKLGQFVVWQPNTGQSANFENGYKQHLNWHIANGDKWNWYGWYIISGPRSGQFVDATMNHEWADFDAALNPAADRLDNQVHVLPFGQVQTIFKTRFLPELSIYETGSLTSKFLKLVTISISDYRAADTLFKELKRMYAAKNSRHFLFFKPVDGDQLDQFFLLIGAGNYEEYGISERLREDLAELESKLKLKKTINSVNSETLVYRADMSMH